ncbi:hypothetical protein DIC75_00060 [Methanoculleus sp. CWC-02]|uniref:Uncharacterized protein n=1 Tax=Methanoculleus oceani TaxID=2184756 RepID=A0ABD4TCV3_9EURY|nr:hypothetical protein [Methanoculleus sp. CWC-02]
MEDRGVAVNTVFDEEPLDEETLRKIERSLEDLRAGRTYTLEEVMAELKGGDRRGRRGDGPR